MRLLLLVGLSGMALAGGEMTQEAVFAGGTPPEGWRVVADGFLSPTYPAPVTRLAIAYGAAVTDRPGSLSVCAVDAATAEETKIAELSTATRGARLELGAGTDFRTFRLALSGAVPVSFVATWPDIRIDPPANVVAAGITGTSFDLTWDAVAEAAGYRVTVWTNRITGFSAGTATWEETFGGMGTSTGNARFGTAGNNKADHAPEWTEFGDDVYLAARPGHIRLGVKARPGWITVPAHGCGENRHLRVCAARLDVAGPDLAVDFVSADGVRTNRHVLALTTTDAVHHQSLADLPDGWKIVLTAASSGSGDCRLELGAVAYIEGYDPGVTHRDVLKALDVTGATAVTVSGLPPVAVSASVQALAAEAARNSAESETRIVDLAHPPQLAVSGAAVAGGGYCEDFERFEALASGTAWADGLTVPCWQAHDGAAAYGRLTVKAGMGNQNAGLYAYHGTNRNEAADYSLAAVAKSGNRARFGFAVTNDTDGVLTDFELGFTARQWTFTAARTVAQSLHVDWLVTNGVVAVSAAGDWREIPALRFDAVASLAIAGDVADEATGSVRIAHRLALDGVRLARGQVLMLRWRPDGVANGEALGVDDVSLRCASGRGTVISIARAVPERE